MSLFTNFTNGIMTVLAGLENNNGTTPTQLPQPNLEPEAYTNPDGSVYDLEDSGPINVAGNAHQQKYTPRAGEKYTDNLPT